MGTTSADDCEPVTVSRRIEAPAESIFRILADPSRHPDLDGSGMLRSVVTNRVISAVGDVFVMKMYFERLGDYEMNNRVGRVRAEPAHRVGARARAGSSRCCAWSGRGQVGAPVGLRTRARRRRCHCRHRDLRLLARARRRAPADGQRPHVDREHDRDARAPRAVVRCGPRVDCSPASARSSMDRASDYGSEGWGFDSLRAR